MMIVTPAKSRKKIWVSRLPWLDWAGQLIRAAFLIAGGIIVGINLCQWRDGSLTTIGLTALGGFVTTGYAFVKKWWDNEKMKKLARKVHDDVAAVKGDPPDGTHS